MQLRASFMIVRETYIALRFVLYRKQNLKPSLDCDECMFPSIIISLSISLVLWLKLLRIESTFYVIRTVACRKSANKRLPMSQLNLWFWMLHTRIIKSMAELWINSWLMTSIIHMGVLETYISFLSLHLHLPILMRECDTIVRLQKTTTNQICRAVN